MSAREVPHREVALFDFTIPTENAARLSRPLAASAAWHFLAAALLFTFWSASVAPHRHLTHERVILIAQAPQERVTHAKIIAPHLREFRAPRAIRVEIPAFPVVSTPSPESPEPNLPDLPAPEISALPSTQADAFREPVPVALPPARRTPVRPSGFESLETNTAKPVPARLHATGAFESASAPEGPSIRRTASAPGGFSNASVSASAVSTPRAALQSGMFADAAVEFAGTAPKPAATTRFTPVEILAKPKPAYTDEARAKQIEGEVLLEIQFSASGEARLLRLVHGLGHGLDEAAVAAARGIRFRPAMRDGLAVDSSAVVHIVFQLAN
ncbi:MAG TPA: TonB family protein [Bryobacteraceae bacterium]|nr:TonB family protein [Bryobacteraceae bacterium]